MFMTLLLISIGAILFALFFKSINWFEKI